MKKLKNKNMWAYLLFWSWNVIFLAFMLFGFAPTLLPELLTAVQAGTIPVNFLVYGTILAVIPLLAVILGLTWLRREPGKLFVLGYGVEGPMMLVLAVRFFLIQQATLAVTFVLVIAALGILTLLWTLLDRKIEERGALLTGFRVAGLTLLLLVGIYVSVWLLFYIIPIIAQSGSIISDLAQEIWRSLTNLSWENLVEGWRFIPFAVLGVLLFAYTGTLFVLMPIAVPITYIRAWWQSIQQLKGQAQMAWVVAVPTAVLVICVLALAWTDPQPQQNAFALLEAPPTTIGEATALLEQEEAIRAGLLNAYLAPRRYLSAEGEMDHISDIYESALNMEPEQAAQVQHLYEGVARPILYKPVNPPAETEFDRWQNQVFIEEPDRAAELYEQFFDEPITNGEKETIVRAVRSTWMPEQARAGWQAVDDREVYLARQETTVTEQGDWAEIEVYEVYENQTGQRQEVVYYFSLPETAVITGIWLGESDDKSEAFSYHVAPRGAAQAVYQNEVRRNVDPALVEQIGPIQYRLRVFPILPQEWDWNEASGRSTLAESPPMHLWFSYRTMADDQVWPMPALADLRNVYWDDETVRLVNGVETAVSAALNAGVSEAWLPSAIPATSPIMPATHLTQFADGQIVQARPATAEDVPEMPADVNVAVVLDRSRSMAKISDDVAAVLTQVDGLADNVDVYLTAAAFRGEEPTVVSLANLNVDDIIYFGGQDAAELLSQFNELYDGQPYDIVLVMTDQTGFGITDESAEIAVPEMPVWMVHLGGNFPLGYDDATLAAIQGSGGGVAATVDEALTRWMVKADAAESDVVTDLVDGYLWQTGNSEQMAGLTPALSAVETAVSTNLVEHEATDDFAALAARQVILAAMQRHRQTLSTLDLLDSLHALAQDQSIVTPYSSMIVLVNERQEQLLKDLEAQDDRFEREFEDVGETETITVTGVPEPEEWLLMLLAGLVLVWYGTKSRRAQTVVDF